MHKYSTEELVAQKPKNFAALPRNPIIFILHNLRSLQNVGLFFRLADAIRAEKIYLTGFTGYPQSGIHAENEINKTAIKLVPFVPWEHLENVLSVLSNLRNLGYSIVGVEQTDVSVNYLTPNYLTPIALLFGHEREGLEEKLLEKCDLVVHIPMLGIGNSHNVAMSGAIISYHLLDKLAFPISFFYEEMFRAGEKVMIEPLNDGIKITPAINMVRKLAGSVAIPDRFKGLTISQLRERAIKEYFATGEE